MSDVKLQPERVWALCPYLRNLNDCMKCPEREIVPPYGAGQRACYGLAHEACLVAFGLSP